MSSLPISYYTPDEYLDRERQADLKSEYLSGEIFAMAGAGEIHNLIVTNLVRELSTRLRGKPCRTYPSDMKVEAGPSGLFSYPDVSVVCGEPRFHDDKRDMVQNPALVVEVLSPSTEAYDRGLKFAQYRLIESLQDYLLVSTNEYRVDQFVRQPDNQWLLSEVTSLHMSVAIAAINCELPLVDIYDRVDSPHFHS